MKLPSIKLPVVNTIIQIRFADIDMLGHVSNAVYPQYFDLGRMDFFMELGKRERPPITVVRAIGYEMKREIRLEDKPVMSTWCSDIGEKSMTINHQITVDDECMVTGSTVLVGFDEATRRACKLPDHWLPSAL